MNIPVPVTDLRVLQTGERILVHFTIPALTTEQLPLPLVRAVDLRFGEDAIAVDAFEAGPVEVRVPLEGWKGKQITVRVRVQSDSGKWSDYSRALEFTAVDAVRAPEIVAESHPRGVRLSWKVADGVKVRVSRRDPAKGEFQVLDEIAGAEWIDGAAPFGVEQSYVGTAIAGAAESEPSKPVTITPEDKFPPSTPRNLKVVTGLKTIEVAWEQSPETDTAGYRVYRAEGGGEFERVTDLIVAASFSDARVESGKQYRYAVSAVDATGNESERSEPVEAAAP
ncbi:MAG: hypothetical protein R2729_00050 [Bryobacteraceae bacterium]